MVLISTGPFLVRKKLEEVDNMKADNIKRRTEGDNPYPRKHKIRPLVEDSILNLPLANAEKKMHLTLRASPDSRALKINFSAEEVKREEFYGYGTAGLSADDKVVYQFILQFGIYDKEKTFELGTAKENVILMVRRTNGGDVSFWIKGNDIEKSKKEKHPSKDFITIHKIGDKTIGYTFTDFLDHVNESFDHVLMELEI